VTANLCRRPAADFPRKWAGRFGGRLPDEPEMIFRRGLTLAPVAQKTLRMNVRAENLYVAWRERCRAVDALRDGSGQPPEKLLQAIWQHQRLKRDELKTSDGKPVRVFHPGFASLEGGPDFRGAVLQIGHDKPVSGDVEIDLQSGGWHAHGHDRNPNFNQVILHVLWDPPKKATALPAVLSLKAVLDAPLPELALALENKTGLPENLRGKCSAPLRELSGSQLTDLLRAAAKIRFQNKAGAILARAKNAGWEAALWENLFRAIGYKVSVRGTARDNGTKAGNGDGLRFRLIDVWHPVWL
jgi:Protein of unknown function (DUF2851)